MQGKSDLDPHARYSDLEAGAPLGPSGGPSRDLARMWLQKWRWYERNALPWNRARIHYELLRRGAFARWPLEGDALQALRDGRLEVGRDTLLEPGVWLTAPAPVWTTS